MKVNTENNIDTAKGTTGAEALSGIKHDSFSQENYDNYMNQFEGDLPLNLEERKAKLKQIEESSSKVILEVVNKINLPLGAKIRITTVGIENSMRNEKDGITFFGCLNQEIHDKSQHNDFVFKMQDQDNDDRCLGRHFQIKYNIALEKYFIKDLGKGFGAFMKVINSVPLKSDSLINIGDSYIVVSLGEAEPEMKENSSNNKGNTNDNSQELNRCITDNNYSLHLKIYSGQLKIEPSTFKADDKAVVRLGRSNEAEVSINDNMLSRLHCYIEFDGRSNTWILFDGYLSEDDGNRKPSTNGTWLYMKEDIEVTSHLIFKANHTVFKTHLTN